MHLPFAEFSKLVYRYCLKLLNQKLFALREHVIGTARSHDWDGVSCYVFFSAASFGNFTLSSRGLVQCGHEKVSKHFLRFCQAAWNTLSKNEDLFRNSYCPGTCLFLLHRRFSRYILCTCCMLHVWLYFNLNQFIVQKLLHCIGEVEIAVSTSHRHC